MNEVRGELDARDVNCNYSNPNPKPHLPCMAAMASDSILFHLFFRFMFLLNLFRVFVSSFLF